jgi:hypothetical protein
MLPGFIQQECPSGYAINVEAYSRHVLDFITTCPETVHIYATLDGRVVGVQTFIRHLKHIELTEGVFCPKPAMLMRISYLNPYAMRLKTGWNMSVTG